MAGAKPLSDVRLQALMHSLIGGQADAVPDPLSDGQREFGEGGGDS